MTDDSRSAAQSPAAGGGDDWLLAGRIGRPHGLDGSVHVTQPRPPLLAAARRLRIADREDEIVRRAGTDARPIIRLASCTSRTDAEALRGRDLLVSRADAPPLEEDEWWPEELEGCRVRDGEREIGSVRSLLAMPSCELLQVARDGGGEDLLVPLIRDAVRMVDIEGGQIDIDLAFLGEGAADAPEAGAAPPADAAPRAAAPDADAPESA
ncbi:ribosome maturation factor RimM [Conexibacter sp. JD483]|uniref:ribosome maturation factor RimM n=1 Tax=unclassified Conexibacter TaxID=2627773 RepID=UPI0027221374|nr:MULTISPECIES: ribosome maturation factor RimM [unclassified Conexibacter]MDO8184524.1 ribosome maturation factor RimM [Conexibacter sp. CPCC 205706]MDO8197830.1 ribosome maturation factor RimM [Conexibacter sp. CPCC 205762]MDR9369236.1 ribosome maturation factor RimM [Conexibacter sp. JD483]